MIVIAISPSNSDVMIMCIGPYAYSMTAK